MTLIITFLSLFLFSPTPVEVSEYLGDWEYEVTADVTYKGIMTLSESNGEFSGKIASEGIEIPFTDVELEGNELSFKMNVQGYPCAVSGTFEGDDFTGVVAVEGYEMPMKATRKG